jgi:hypothetical protein
MPQVSFLGGERRKKSCLHATGSLIFTHLCFYRVCFGEVRACRCRRRGHHGLGRWRALRCWCLFVAMPRVSSVRWPSSMVNLWRLTGPERRLKRKFKACQTHRPRARDDYWLLRWSAETNLGNFPFCGLGAPSCASPSSVSDPFDCEDAGRCPLACWCG